MIRLGQHNPNCPSASNSIRLRLCWTALLLVVVCGLFVQSGNASNGDNVVVPMARAGPTYSTQSGLQIRVDSTLAGNRGYRPLRVTATTPKPAAADTLITINFQARGWRNSRRAINVESDFELTQGSTSTTTTFSVPQYVDWNSVSWEVWVDRVKDEQLCLDMAGFNSGTSGAVAAGIFATGLWKASPAQLIQAAANNSIESHDFDLSSLPNRWVDYTPLDVMATTIRSLNLVRVSSPNKFAELLRWVRSGGNLWVVEVGQDFSELPELELLLNPSRDVKNLSQYPKTPSPQALPVKRASPENGGGGFGTAAEDPSLDEWHFLKLDGTGRSRLNDLVTLSMEVPDEDGGLSTVEIADSHNPQRAVDSRSWMIARAYGLGTIVAFQSTRGKNSSDVGEMASALQRSSLAENLQWATRHGNDPAVGNPNFNNLLIPDVGAAPVFEFQMLISLFVIGIGPVNYWLLKRRDQLPLLLVTVPVAASVATLMLFAYGFLADGIGVRVRARSLTMLDQRAGEVASWARLSYYAGIAPSEGLRMPVETVVYPILPSRSEYNSFGRRHVNQQRALEWSKQQRLTRGWLASRTPTQYLAVTALPTKKHLKFDVEAKHVRVTNQLGTQVLALVVQDHEGKLFEGDLIEVESSGILHPSTFIKAASKIRKFLTDNLPQLPDGYVQNRRSRQGDYGVATSEGLMELQLEAIVAPAATGWGNGTYIAVTATGIEVPLGVEGATETNSFHVVRGTW